MLFYLDRTFYVTRDQHLHKMKNKKGLVTVLSYLLGIKDAVQNHPMKSMNF